MGDLSKTGAGSRAPRNERAEIASIGNRHLTPFEIDCDSAGAII
jgi:hypothetical protein